MDVYLLDKNFIIVDIVQNYKSLIWTERYDDHGDCIIVTIKNKPSDFPIDYYLFYPESDDLMIIEESELKWDIDDGVFTEVRARAATSLLERRIIWTQTNIESVLEPAVKKILDENVISPSVTARKLDGLSFAYAGATVPSIYTVEAQLLGTKVYKAINDLCEPYDVGFRVRYLREGRFQFRLYGGINRSATQDLLPRVIFSPEFDNLDRAGYLRSKRKYSNVVLVGGEGEGNKKKFRTINRSGTNVTGMNRYEEYESASGVSSNGETLTPAKYNAYLDSVGRTFLKDHGMTIIFDGETDRATASRFGTDYLLGDLVQISDGATINSPARIVEYIRSDDSQNGLQTFPSLRIKE